MDSKTLTKNSKFLSLVLRHRPEVIGIQLDEQGWVSVETLLEQLRAHGRPLSREELAYIVAHNNKKRFSFDDSGMRIRASQGHSVRIELGYSPTPPPEFLFHGTARKNLEAIRQQGLHKGKRHHVHLSADMTTARQVGGRHGKPVILTVQAGKMQEAGFAFFLSENGVWLTEQVPVKFLEFPD